MSVRSENKAEICVIHVDDNKEIADVTGEYLTQQDERIDYHTAQTVEEGYELLIEQPVDCVISDYEMPGANGIEFLERVREFDSEVPFILYTGKGSEEVASDAFSAGASDYFQKESHPDHYTVLVNRVITLVERQRAQKRQEEHLAAIESAEDAIAILTAEGVIDFANPSMVEMYDMDAESLIGTHIAALHADSAADRIRTEVLPAIQTQGVWTGQLQAYAPSRGEFEARCTVSQAADGKAVLSMIDISKQVESRRELTRYEAIVDAVGDPVYVLDDEGKFLYVNNSFVNTFGYPAEQVVGQSVELVKDETAIAQGRNNLRRVLSDDGPDSVCFETEIQSMDGETITCMDHMKAVMTDEGFVGSAGVLRDITEQKEREQKLRQQNKRLERFASTLAHDIRNPLSVAMAELELTRDECSSERLSKVSESLTQIERIIADLLELAQTAETEVASVDLESVACESWEQVESAESTLSVDAQETVIANRSQLQRLFVNLFSNSLNHSDGNVIVSVGTLPDGFYVDDTGPGIPVADRNDVFETGYTTDPDGSGYGLGIVQNIVLNHSWDMQLGESPSGGLRVTITGVSQSQSTTNGRKTATQN